MATYQFSRGDIITRPNPRSDVPVIYLVCDLSQGGPYSGDILYIIRLDNTAMGSNTYPVVSNVLEDYEGLRVYPFSDTFDSD